MKIKDIHIDGYGLYHDEDVKNIPGELSLFLGKNEAGKSTLLSFIRTVFFGFSRKNSKENFYPPLSGGNHGGSIKITDTKGKDFRIERYVGPSGGKVTLHLPDGKIGDGDDLNQILLGTNRELYNNIYAFSLTELQAFESLRGDGVKNALYSASSGTGMMAIPETQKYLKNKQEEIYKSRGSKQLLNTKFAELRDLNDQISTSTTETGEFDKLMEALKGLDTAIKKKRNAVSSLAVDKNRFAALRELWTDWIQYGEFEEEFVKHPIKVEKFPDNGLEIFEQEKRTLEERNSNLSRMLINEKELAVELEGIEVNDLILKMEGELTLLFDLRASFKADFQDLPRFKERLSVLDNEIQGELANLGIDWNEEKIAAFDRSLATHEAVKRFRDVLREQVLAREKAKENLTGKKSDLEALLLEKKREEKELETYTPILPGIDKEKVEALREGKKHFAALIAEAKSRENELAELEQEIEEAVKNIDCTWTSENAASFDVSLLVRQRIEDFERDLDDTEKAVSHAHSRFEDAEIEVKNLQKELQRAEKELKEQSAPTFSFQKGQTISSETEVKDLLVTCRSLLEYLVKQEKLQNEVRHVEDRMEDKNAQLKDYGGDKEEGKKKSLTLPLFLGSTGCALIGASVFYGTIPELLFLGGFFGIASLVLFIRQQGGKSGNRAHINTLRQQVTSFRDRLNALDDELKEVNEWVVGLIDKLGEAQLTSKQVRIIEGELLGSLSTMSERKQQERDVKRIRDGLEEKRTFLNSRTKEMEEHEDSHESIKKEWKSWLNERGLSEDIRTPKIGSLVLGRIDSVKEKLKLLDSLEKKITELQEEKDNYISLAGVIPGISLQNDMEPTKLLEKVEAFFVGYRDEEERQKKREYAENNLENIHKRKQSLEEAIAKAEETLKVTSAEEKKEQTSWQMWLKERGFHPDLSPETALEEGIRAIENAATKIKDKEILVTSIQLKEKVVTEFLHTTATVAKKLGREKPEDEQAAHFVQELEGTFDKQKESRTKQEGKKAELERVRQQLKHVEEQVTEANETIKKLMHSANCTNDDDFREKGRRYSERKRLEESLANLRKNLLALSGEKDFDTLKKTLSETDLHQLEVEVEKTRLFHKELEQELNALVEQKADLKHKTENLMSSEELSQLRSQKEETIEEVRRFSREWTRFAIAEHLIKEAKERFEKKEQPKVIRDSGDYFREITAGRYQSVIAPVGEEDIYAETPDGKRRKGEELSRGTAEQLYLALRFGYIENYSSKKGALPVIMDDIFVNFDPDRARESVRAILKMAKNHQIFFFTCHPSTVEIFREEAGHVNLFSLEKGSVTQEK